ATHYFNFLMVASATCKINLWQDFCFFFFFLHAALNFYSPTHISPLWEFGITSIPLHHLYIGFGRARASKLYLTIGQSKRGLNMFVFFITLYERQHRLSCLYNIQPLHGIRACL
ncbi:hypothetical protein ACJX0J_020908, partial [Zea mays]